jgi:hypothetical protein
VCAFLYPSSSKTAGMKNIPRPQGTYFFRLKSQNKGGFTATEHKLNLEGASFLLAMNDGSHIIYFQMIFGKLLC